MRKKHANRELLVDARAFISALRHRCGPIPFGYVHHVQDAHDQTLALHKAQLTLSKQERLNMQQDDGMVPKRFNIGRRFIADQAS